MRIAAFNVQNLFDRAKALNGQTWVDGRKILAAYAQLNDLLQEDPYTPADQQRILALLEQLGLLRGDESRFVRLRRIRGALLRRRRSGEASVVATGRSSWIGWVELITEHVDQLAMEHTAMVIRDVGADALGVIEAESRQLLQMFTSAMLKKVGGRPYEQVMLIDGNDPRGIDVGLLARAEYPISSVRSHIFDTDAQGLVFSRDCCEYHLRTPAGEPLIVLVTHLKSKGYGSRNDPIGAGRRHRQATRMAEIYRGLIDDGARYVALIGDFNDDPTSESLAPLLAGTTARDISEHPSFDPGPRSGTFQGGNHRSKIDYVLLSPDLFGRVVGGGIFRTPPPTMPRSMRTSTWPDRPSPPGRTRLEWVGMPDPPSALTPSKGGDPHEGKKLSGVAEVQGRVVRGSASRPYVRHEQAQSAPQGPPRLTAQRFRTARQPSDQCPSGSPGGHCASQLRMARPAATAS